MDRLTLHRVQPLAFPTFARTFFYARAHSKAGGTGSVGTKTRRWRWAAFAGYFVTGHKGSVKENAEGGSKPIQALPPAHGSVMDHLQFGFDQNFSGAADDFPSLLRRKGLLGPALTGPMPQNQIQQQMWQPTETTPILAVIFV